MKQYRCHDKSGTELYWPPEMHKDDWTVKIDGYYAVPADIWAFGVILYELCGGDVFEDDKVTARGDFVATLRD